MFINFYFSLKFSLQLAADNAGRSPGGRALNPPDPAVSAACPAIWSARLNRPQIAPEGIAVGARAHVRLVAAPDEQVAPRMSVPGRARSKRKAIPHIPRPLACALFTDVYGAAAD